MEIDDPLDRMVANDDYDGAKGFLWWAVDVMDNKAMRDATATSTSWMDDLKKIRRDPVLRKEALRLYLLWRIMGGP